MKNIIYLIIISVISGFIGAVISNILKHFINIEFITNYVPLILVVVTIFFSTIYLEKDKLKKE